MIKVRLFLLSAIMVAAVWPLALRAGDETSILVVMIDRSAHGFTYRVDGRDTDTDLLRYLNKHEAEFPTQKTKVILLVHEKATLATMNNSRGVIMKAGYEPPRVFQFNDDKRAMIEITFSPGVPFSVRGPS